MAYSLVTAAAAIGVNRTTVLRAIKGGKISAQRDAQGAWQIEPCELHRVFPPLPVAEPAQSSGQAGEIALLRTLVEELRTTVTDLRRREEDLKLDRDHWREALSAAQRLLPKAEPEAAPPVPGTSTRQRRSFWKWVGGAG
jgi:hypothetical protein